MYQHIKCRESYMHSEEPLITEFLASTISLNEKIADQLPAAKGSFDELDEFYRKVVKR